MKNLNDLATWEEILEEIQQKDPLYVTQQYPDMLQSAIAEIIRLQRERFEDQKVMVEVQGILRKALNL